VSALSHPKKQIAATLICVWGFATKAVRGGKAGDLSGSASTPSVLEGFISESDLARLHRSVRTLERLAATPPEVAARVFAARRIETWGPTGCRLPVHNSVDLHAGLHRDLLAIPGVRHANLNIRVIL